MKDNFLEELEKRLEENRRVAERGILPRFMWGAASYLGFHQFRMLLVVALGVTVMMFMFWYPTLIRVSKLLFIFI
jgi:hypothetical protein